MGLLSSSRRNNPEHLCRAQGRHARPLGARLGLKTTLLLGLLLQATACAALAHFADALTVPIVTVAQGVSGVAKDLIKMSSKSYVRFVAPASYSTGLLSWVSWITGSKPRTCGE